MRTFWFTIACCFFSTVIFVYGCSSSKNTQSPPEVTKENIKVVTETTPAIIGGLDALHQQLRYPAHLYADGTKIMLEANVLIDAEGNVNRISFNKDKYPELKAAAEKAIRKVRFVPGKRDGKEVDMFVTLPIQFTF
ncbi:TonB family protein [Fodinibius sp. Rm-B-1B1-1]|uniref:TonB family protein n=1 Tax=Fodinibius alkaliphilus TaxID=3140241 RepID=UPI00315B140D